MMELSQLATKYSQQQYDSYTYTPEEIAASYAENKDSYDTFSYQYYFVQADTEDTTDDDGNTSAKTTDATMAAAKATADKIAAATHDADSFTAAVTANVPAKGVRGRHDHCAERHGQYRHQGLGLQLRRVRRLALQRRPPRQ